ncbi:MAG: pilus assembly protein PilP [Arenimonas sp.]|nr:pilus assembly protein PilP [Arenimonas sp.]MBP6309129.1 pilus assembly protein PilP [Arenimonas sp.]
MSKSTYKNIVFLILVVSLLTACTRGNTDLLSWISQVKNRPAPPLDPLPLVEDPPVVVYSALGMRDPFGKPPLNRMSTGSGPSPDLNRRRQPLEAFSLDSLSMVGTIGKDKNLIGLILAPDKVTYRVTPGVYLGQSDGRVLSISPNQIEMMELVPDGNGGWMERQASIALNESNSGDKK